MTTANDADPWGGSGDRWFTGSLRGHRDVVPAGAGVADGASEQTPWTDELALDVAGGLDLFAPQPAAGRRSFTTVAAVAGLELYTPEDISSPDLVADDRPYAAWTYVGVVRYDTQLDPDGSTRRDVETEVELDLGLVGPVSQAERIQGWLHVLVDSHEPNGWDHQLDNEPGVVLRGRRSRREAYAGALTVDGLAADVLSALEGAVGNIDTHAAVGGTFRLGWNLPRSFGKESGDRSRLLPGAARPASEPASLYGFVDLEGRLVLRNLFLDGNTFSSSHSIDKRELVGELRAGVMWEWGDWGFGYTFTRRGEEFEHQHEPQAFGAYVISYTPRP